jgi:hypothetical protein
MAVKPVPHLDWVTGDEVARITEPSGGKKLLGWLSGEKPAFQFFNWLFNRQDKWNKYFETVTDTMAANFDVIIGAGADATHATLAAAVADVALGPNLRVLVKDAYTVNTTINLTKPGWRIYFKPGADYTKGTALTGIQLNADRLELHGARFLAFSVSGDKAVQSLAGADYCRVMNSNFVSCDSEIDDSLAAVTALGNITE